MEERNYCVYKHTSPSGKVYIGLTGGKPEYRWNNGNGYRGNEYFNNAIKKYGWENIENNVIKENLTKQEASEMEVKLIDKHNANNPEYGYNLTSGGESGFKLSDESIKKGNISRLENGFLKIGYEKAKKIRYLYNETNVSSSYIREKFRICPATLSNIVNNVIWKQEGYAKSVDNKAEKLTYELACEMRRLYQETDLSRKEVSDIYQIHERHASAVIANKFWREDGYENIRDKQEAQEQSLAGKEIRRLYDETSITSAELSEKFGVSASYINMIINNQYWSDDKYVKPSRSYEEKTADTIRSLYQEGKGRQELSEIYNYDIAYIGAIVRNEALVCKQYVNERDLKAEALEFEMANAIRNRYQESDLNKKEVAEEFEMCKLKVGKIIRNQVLVDEGYINYKDDKKHWAKVQKGNKIREEYAQGNFSQSELAEKHNLELHQIHRIVSQGQWTAGKRTE